MDFASSPWLWDSGTPRPTFERDFARDKELDRGGTGPAITFTRASQATFFDASGTLQTAANDAPRFDHDPATGASRGLLIEESRTNSAHNSQAADAVVGVIGSGGVVPTNWTMSFPTGIDQEVVATGTVSGMNYVDLRWNGTATAAGTIQILTGNNVISAASGQTWTGSMYIALVGGSYTNLTGQAVRVAERNSGGGALAGTSASFTATSALSRASATRTFNNADTARTTFAYLANVADGATIDITLRIAAPQLEQGAFATSYIPTTTAAATRAADSAVVTPISSFYNQSEGTLFAEFRSGVDLSGPRVVQIDDEASSSIQIIGAASAGAGAYFFTSISGTNKATAPTSNPNLVANTIYKVAGSVSSAGVFASRNGETAAQSANGEYPTGLTRMIMGGSGGTALNGHIRKIAYWPKRLTNTLLEQLTT
jgi:hypothetical protein